MITYIDQLEELKETAKDNVAVKTAFKGDTDWVSTIREIGINNNLNLSQLGVIYDLTNQLLIGKLEAANFTERLKKIGKEEDWDELQNEENINRIVKELNEKIFIPIRQAMMKAGEGRKEETEEDHAKLNKDDILHEIEHPVSIETKTYAAASVPSAVTTATGAVPFKTAPAVNSAPKPSIPATMTNVSAPTAIPPQQKVTTLEIEPEMDLITAKLAGAVKVPMKEVKFTPVSPTPAQQKPLQKYTVDPYREPIK